MFSTREIGTLVITASLTMLACQHISTNASARPCNTAALKQMLTPKIDALVADKSQNIGVLIQPLLCDDTIYQSNAQKMMTPSSVNKLFTATAALDILGPEYRYTTSVLQVPAAHHRVTLIVKGSGDPSLSAQDLAKLAGIVAQKGVKHVDDIVIDDSIFDDKKWSAGWMWDDLQSGFSAPVSGLNVSFNRILVETSPGQKVGQPVYAVLDPQTHYVKLHNRGITSKSGNSLTIGIENQKGPLQHGDTININGQLGFGGPVGLYKFAVEDPALFAGFLFEHALKQQGITVSGKVMRGSTPATATPIATNVSQTLDIVLSNAMKMSFNLPMEAVVKTIGAKTSNGQGSWDNGLTAINAFLKNKIGIDSGLVIQDGSGLSRYNLANSVQLVQLLKRAYLDPQIGVELIRMLPVGKRDGTLRKYAFSAADDEIAIRAKTGIMSGTRGMAGYVLSKNGDVYVFAILINGQTTTNRPTTPLEVQILNTFIDAL